jgi:ATP-dependent exoDNAse (exonuclease V) alpha subunit
MISYSITISKSQSLSIDNAILDLGNCFTDGMLYVAISRIRNLNGVYIEQFNERGITVNKKMKEYMEQLNVCHCSLKV